MSSVFAAIGHVNTPIMLTAFIAAVLLYGFVKWLRSREKRDIAAVNANNTLAIARIRSHYGIPTENLPATDIKDILLQKIRLSSRKWSIIAYVIMWVALVVGIVAVASFLVAPSQQPKASSAGGALGNIVNSINAGSGDFTITLSDQATLGNLWVNDVSGANSRAIVQKICSITACLACDPTPPAFSAATTHVTIGLGGKLEPFKDQFGATWQRCASG